MVLQAHLPNINNIQILIQLLSKSNIAVIWCGRHGIIIKQISRCGINKNNECEKISIDWFIWHILLQVANISYPSTCFKFKERNFIHAIKIFCKSFLLHKSYKRYNNIELINHPLTSFSEWISVWILSFFFNLLVCSLYLFEAFIWSLLLLCIYQKKNVNCVHKHKE